MEGEVGWWIKLGGEARFGYRWKRIPDVRLKKTHLSTLRSWPWPGKTELWLTEIQGSEAIFEDFLQDRRF